MDNVATVLKPVKVPKLPCTLVRKGTPHTVTCTDPTTFRALAAHGWGPKKKAKKKPAAKKADGDK